MSQQAAIVFIFTVIVLTTSQPVWATMCSEVFSGAKSKFDSSHPARGFFHQYEKIELNDKVIAISVHPSSTFDHNSTTKESAIKVNNFVRSPGVGMRSISLVKGFHNNNPEKGHFLLRDEIDVPILSQYGSHKLRLPKLKAAVITGGYFEICLKNAFRQLIEGVSPSTRKLDLYFVTDAIYVSNLNVGHVDLNKKRGFKRIGLPQIPLIEILKFISGENLIRFLDSSLEIHSENSHVYIGLRKDTKFIPKGITLNYILGQKLLRSFGNGVKEVNIHLVNQQELESIFL